MYITTTGQGGRIKRGGEGLHQEDATPKYNLTKEEHKALEELKKDKTRMILTTDKGVPLWF